MSSKDGKMDNKKFERMFEKCSNGRTGGRWQWRSWKKYLTGIRKETSTYR